MEIHGSREQQVGGQEPLSRLDALRFVRRFVEQQAVRQLRLIESWIAAEERREAEQRRGAERRPAPPEWLVQYGLNHSNIDAVHTVDCRAGAQSGRCRPATRQQALDALLQAPPCIHCRPDTSLGILDEADSFGSLPLSKVACDGNREMVGQAAPASGLGAAGERAARAPGGPRSCTAGTGEPEAPAKAPQSALSAFERGVAALAQYKARTGT
ncbi:DUF6233 domain-containing protein [Streptomyces sp. NPDC089424]|uniref:DUF6233 domain-containing protein n=1 Tax=Streptomyces sp. NPDC089424 TaxID=3365917 RepID=UPI0037FA9827